MGRFMAQETGSSSLSVSLGARLGCLVMPIMALPRSLLS
jgi:hypothetical protein